MNQDINPENQDEETPHCLICYNDLDLHLEKIALSGKCNHPDAIMHRKCMKAWLRVKAECPICRAPLSRNDIFSNGDEQESSSSITPPIQTGREPGLGFDQEEQRRNRDADIICCNLMCLVCLLLVFALIIFVLL